MAFNRVAWTVAASVALASLFGAGGKPRPAKYPDNPVKVLVGFSAGGGTDVAARVVGLKLGEALGQTFVIENRPGASGLIAADGREVAGRRLHDNGRQPDHARGCSGALPASSSTRQGFTGIAMSAFRRWWRWSTSSPIKSIKD